MGAFGREQARYSEVQGAEHGECYGRPYHRAFPYYMVVAFVVEQAVTAYQYAEHEQEQGLGKAAVLDGPREVYGESVAYTGYCYVEP